MTLTKSQRKSVADLYKASPDGAKSYLQFRRRVRLFGTKNDRYAGLGWCGMFVGIEKDGHTHT